MAETIRSVLEKTEKYFREHGIADTPRLDAEVLLADALNIDRVGLYVDFEKPLSIVELGIYREVVRKRAARMPVAYITGKKNFMSGEYHVNPSVLIPRPETEVLLEATCEYLREANVTPKRCIDLGTGSGVLAIELAKAYEHLHIFAVDISSDSLDVAKANAKRHEVYDRVCFVCGSLFAPLNTIVDPESCELIISNPPYIATADMDMLQPEVSKFEPRIALDGGEDGLEFYRKIGLGAKRFLKPLGIVALEVGAGQAEAVVNIFMQQGYVNLVVSKDYSGIERVVVGQR